MRILYLTHQYFPRHVGGTEVYTRGLARRARAASHSVEVLTYHESPSPHADSFGLFSTEHEGIAVTEVHYNLSVAPEPARFEYDNAFVRGLTAQVLDRFQPDIVHVMHAMKLSGSAVGACLNARIPTVVTLCDFWFLCPRHTLLTWDGRLCGGPARSTTCLRCLHHTHGFPDSPLYNGAPEWLAEMVVRIASPWARRSNPGFWHDVHAIKQRQSFLAGILRRADRVLALSGIQKALMVQNGFPEDRIEVLDHGLETGGLDPGLRSPATHPPRFVFIGTLAPHKGVHVLIDALARVPDLNLTCDIYGAGSGDPYVQRVREQASRDHRIRLMGTFPPEELGRVLSNASVLVMPALWYENNPLVVKAALQMGIPVLASRIGCLPEWVRPGVNGWLADPDDADAWAVSLTRAQHEFEMLTGRAGTVKSMETHAREVLEIYDETAGRRCE